MIKLRDLEYLLAVAEHKHFGRAAEACFVSQPTLSGQIMKLEQQLELALFERHKRQVLLTPAGEVLIREAREVIRAAGQFQACAKSLLDPLAGELHAGLIPTLAPYLLPHIMPTLGRELENINFYLHEEKTQDLLTQLNDGSLDFAILPYLDEMEAFERYDLFNEELLLAMPVDHPLAQKPDLQLQDLHDHSVLTLQDGHCLRDQAMGYCFAAGAREDQRFRASSLETLRHMVAAGSGVTLLPRLSTLNRQSDEGIVYRGFSEPAPTRQISLLIRSNYSRMPAIRKVVGLVREAVKQL